MFRVIKVLPFLKNILFITIKILKMILKTHKAAWFYCKSPHPVRIFDLFLYFQNIFIDNMLYMLVHTKRLGVIRSNQSVRIL